MIPSAISLHVLDLCVSCTYRKTLILALVNKIYLYDDGRLTIVLNDGNATAEIELNLIDEIEKEVPVQVDSGGYFLDDDDPPNGNNPNL